MSQKLIVSNTDAVDFLRGTLDTEHSLFQQDEATRRDIVDARCSSIVTEAWFRVHKSIANPVPTMRKKLIEQMSEKDRWVYSLVIRSLKQSRLKQSQVQHVFGTLHSRAVEYAETRLALVFDASAQTEPEYILNDYEREALSHITRGDLGAKKPNEAFYNILERASGPMQDVTYFTTAVAFRIVDAFYDYSGREMQKKEFDQITNKLMALLSNYASGSRKKLTLNLVNFLFHPEAIQFEINPKSGDLSFSVRPHNLDELLPLMQGDIPSSVYIQHFSNGSGCPALRASFLNHENEGCSVFSAIESEFLDLFSSVLFNGDIEGYPIHSDLCRYECL